MEVKFVSHLDCSNLLLRKISSLKKQHWNYTIEEHLEWFSANLLDIDIHVCVFQNTKMVAYTTIQNIDYFSDDQISTPCFGIGGVCVDKNNLNKRFGLFVVQMASAYIKQKNAMGLLLCKDELVGFYQKNNWIKFDGYFEISKFDKYCNLLSTDVLQSNKIYLNKAF